MNFFLQDVIVRFMRNAVSVEPLGRPTMRRGIEAGDISAVTALTPTCTRISILAIGADIRFELGFDDQIEASTVTHLILQNERLDIKVPANTYIAVVRNANTTGFLEIMELSN